MSKFLEYFNLKFKEEKSLKLTKSQLNLLKLLASGLTIQKIAEKLEKRYATVERQTQRLYHKIGVFDRNMLIKQAITEGFITTKDVKPLFRKRFIKQTDTVETIPELPEEFSEREIIFLTLSGMGKTHTEIIQLMGLYGTYPIWELKRSICAKLNCKNITEAMYIIGKLYKKVYVFYILYILAYKNLY